MRVRFLVAVLLVALLHFGVLAFAFWRGFVIFRGPTTGSEIFWDHVVRGLLFPTNLLLPMVRAWWVQSVLMVLNSLLWGFVGGSVYVRLRKSH